MEVRAMLNWAVAHDDKGEEQSRLLDLTEEAYSMWHEFAQIIEEGMRPGGELEHFTDWAGKAPGAAARLAGVLHGIKHSHGRPWEVTISAETMYDALEIMWVVKQHSLAVMDMMGADPTIASARHLWQWIERRRQAGFKVRDAFNALRGTFPRVHFLNTALEALEERGYVSVIEPPNDGRGRPPSPIVQVRPDITAKWR
jgi:hypothetical protein